MVGVVGVVVVVGGLCGAFVHGGCVGCIVCWLLGAWRLLGWLGLWVVVVGWCRLGCGEGCGVCVERRVLGLFFFGVPFLCFVGEQCGACAAAGAVLHTGARVRGCAFRFASAAVSWMQNRQRAWVGLCVTHRAGHEQT